MVKRRYHGIRCCVSGKLCTVLERKGVVGGVNEFSEHFHFQREITKPTQCVHFKKQNQICGVCLRWQILSSWEEGGDYNQRVKINQLFPINY